MNPLWLMALIPSRIVFEQRNCSRCGETHELVQRIARTRFRCRKCSAPLSSRKTGGNKRAVNSTTTPLKTTIVAGIGESEAATS